MAGSILERLFEHNNWANDRIIQACAVLTAEQLDAEPKSATQGSIRSTLVHLAEGQRGYLRLLTLPVEERRAQLPGIPFTELQRSAKASGEALLDLARDESALAQKGRAQETGGYSAEPWVVMLQVINHATEHREQIKSMLTSLGVTPPNIDGWDYGEFTGAYS